MPVGGLKAVAVTVSKDIGSVRIDTVNPVLFTEATLVASEMSFCSRLRIKIINKITGEAIYLVAHV